MAAATLPWYPAAPSEVPSERASLTLGLRSAELHFNELVVPGLGRVWFVRQLSWAAAGLRLSAKMGEAGRRVRPDRIARGLEALGCKLEYAFNGASERVIGTRAFGRDEDDSDTWTFDALTQRRHYVLNTYRAMTTRALRADGLGFATNARFTAMRLEAPGRTLADLLLQQSPVGKGPNTRLGSWLERWMEGQATPGGKTVRKALSPNTPTSDERRIVRERVFEVDDGACEKRCAILDACGAAKEVPPLEARLVPALERAGHGPQARELRLAIAFGHLYDGSIGALAATSRLLESQRSVTVDAALRSAPVRRAVRSVRAAAREYEQRLAAATGLGHPDATSFAEGARRSNDARLLEDLVRRDSQVLAWTDAAIHQGPLFRVLDASTGDGEREGATDQEDRSEVRTFRIANLLSLARECGWKGAWR